MSFQTTLALPLSQTDRTVTIAHPNLTVGQVVILEDEQAIVTEVITPTQGRLLRGHGGTLAADHQTGTEVWLQSRTVRVRRAQPDITPREAICPTCGRPI